MNIRAGFNKVVHKELDNLIGFLGQKNNECERGKETVQVYIPINLVKFKQLSLIVFLLITRDGK